MKRRYTPHRPGSKTHPRISERLVADLQSVTPSRDRSLEYRPCQVTLDSGSVVSCVYVVDAESYLDMWGVWPEDDPSKQSLRIDEVASITESPFRLPARFASQIYSEGESGMGYTIFTVVFADGTEQACSSGNAIDFIFYPEGKSATDVVGVVPHMGHDASPKPSPQYHWCLFSPGLGANGSSDIA